MTHTTTMLDIDKASQKCQIKLTPEEGNKLLHIVQEFFSQTYSLDSYLSDHPPTNSILVNGLMLRDWQRAKTRFDIVNNDCDYTHIGIGNQNANHEIVIKGMSLYEGV